MDPSICVNTPQRMPPELMIQVAEELPEMSDLARLARTSRVWNRIVMPLLYTLDARVGNSHAIGWVALKCKRDDVGLEIIRLSRRHGGNVNAVHGAGSRRNGYASALHFAAARGRHALVDELLRMGADPQALSSGMDVFFHTNLLRRSRGRLHGPEAEAYAILLDELHDAARVTRWMPLMVPLICRHTAVVQLLVKACAAKLAGARAEAEEFRRREAQQGQGILASCIRPTVPPAHGLPMRHVHDTTLHVAVKSAGSWAARPFEEVITAFHLLAAMTADHLVEDWGVYDAIFAEHGMSIDAGIPIHRYSALHLAVKAGSRDMFERLIRHGARVDLDSTLGRTPLMYAITQCSACTWNARRATLIQMIHRLLDKGADVNHRSVAAVAETPLICAVPVEQMPWTSQHWRDVRAVIKLLITMGARVNEPSATGSTVAHRLCREIVRGDGNATQLERLLAIMVTEHGASVRPSESPNLPSMLGLCCLSFGARLAPTRLLHMLLSWGADISDGETDQVFVRWFMVPELRRSRLDLVHRCKGRLSQVVVNKAYHHAVANQDRGLWDSIHGVIGAPTNGSRLMAIGLATHNHRLWPIMMRELAFNGNYVNSRGETFLHMIVAKLDTTANYRESAAIKDAEFFLNRQSGAGADATSLRRVAKDGKTALQRLAQLGRTKNTKLRLLLYDAREDQVEGDET
ncbi:hypothetical protein DCS_06780 [Drechmeria coniospora]|uniref:F-box domain-containing protein n=1 Tax=Drechmeria coniospora TaxID=98403 RepID=A0A151GCJ7_DRECN|nr:hypothetical protein DCS_06780 [Drechmeria coniospora]KYK54820.1 hypothetical protein DCS_06780 [Drechmeria coniospora]